MELVVPGLSDLGGSRKQCHRNSEFRNSLQGEGWQDYPHGAYTACERYTPWNLAPLAEKY